MPRVRVGEVELCYETMGEGAPMLLVMGIGCQLVFWPEGLCRELAERGFRVIRFDNRDVGESSRLDHLGVPNVRRELVRWLLGLPVRAPYSLDAMADDAAGLLTALGVERAHVVGTSMGGMIAQLLAIRHPERVASLTSIMSHPGDRWSSLAKPRALRALLQPPPRTREEAEALWLRFFGVVGSPGFPLDEADVRARAARQFERGVGGRGVARQFTAILAGTDRRPALRRLDVPALVVHGAEDPLVPRRGGEQTARALEGAELLCIPGMGHDLPRAVWPRLLDAIERVAAVDDPAAASTVRLAR
jgi:pimeloyl-ACP methyl ester carboxylesterase